MEWNGATVLFCLPLLFHDVDGQNSTSLGVSALTRAGVTLINVAIYIGCGTKTAVPSILGPNSGFGMLSSRISAAEPSVLPDSTTVDGATLINSESSAMSTSSVA